MRLNAPKKITWFISLFLGVVAVVGYFVTIPYVTPYVFWLLLVGLVTRGVWAGRAPWGNMYEFSIAFAVGILGGYLFLQRRYPIRSIAFLPLGVALFLVGYASTLPAP